jgi:NTP pyrophosphatase (non-canonical NTP hydrolase)
MIKTIKELYKSWNPTTTMENKVTETPSLTTLANTIHRGNVKRGFYDDPKEVGTVLMLIVTELAEAMESYRSNNSIASDRMETLEWDSKEDEPFTTEDINQFKLVVKDTFEDEIADTIIRLFDLCGWMNIDIHKHIMLKLKYNDTRPYKHGKAF